MPRIVADCGTKILNTVGANHTSGKRFFRRLLMLDLDSTLRQRRITHALKTLALAVLDSSAGCTFRFSDNPISYLARMLLSSVPRGRTVRERAPNIRRSRRGLFARTTQTTTVCLLFAGSAHRSSSHRGPKHAPTSHRCGASLKLSGRSAQLERLERRLTLCLPYLPSLAHFLHTGDATSIVMRRLS